MATFPDDICYTELLVTTNFSFLRGASHPEELMEHAAALGYREMAVTDVNTLAGMVRAHVAAKKAGIRLIPGCQVQIDDGPDVLIYPKRLSGYESLCHLLTTGNMRTEKGKCLLYKNDLHELLKDIKLIVLPPDKWSGWEPLSVLWQQDVLKYAKWFGNDTMIAMQCLYTGSDRKMHFQLAAFADEAGIPLVATNAVLYHHSQRRQLQDVLTCIREKTTIHEAGYLLQANAERHLKEADEMIRLFREYPEAIANTQRIVEECCFSLDALQYNYPVEITTEGRTPQQELEMLAWQGAYNFYGNWLSEKTKAQIIYELRFIEEMNYAAYFLTVYDIVRFARSRNILCQGRGSAANSTVCFCLGITCVNPEKFDLLFERFISAARNEPPDIDVDFEHERREEVMQYIYEKYGRDRAAIVATVTTQHAKGAVRDVAKAMGLSLDAINKISATLTRIGHNHFSPELMREAGIDATEPYLQKVFNLTEQFMGFPRQLGQHTGGFVITNNKLHQLCPIINARMPGRTNIEWNKDDVEALGFLKIDVLALGMLTCIRKCFDLLEQHYGKRYELATIPQEDPAVYDMICAADTIGVFQIESRAQQTMLPRLKPRCFYDLVIEVAIVRPGPIQGDMVHPYLRRRNGEEKVDYPCKELEDILGRTLGVPLFQEQAMKIAIVAAGFTPTEADELRRSMATFKVKGKVTELENKLIKGMTERGLTKEYAQRVFRQLEGFGSYGFPESHAASFAQLVYVSSWIKCYYPDVFACALLNSLPMGFYQPAQIVQDAKRHNVEVLPVDVNYSTWDHQLESIGDEYFAIRLGMRQVKGLKQGDAEKLIQQRGPCFASMQQILQTDVSEVALQKLADADAFRSLDADRREALWQTSVKDIPTGLFADYHESVLDEENIDLPKLPLQQQVMFDYATTSLSVKEHLLSFLRQDLIRKRVVTNTALHTVKDGIWVSVAGLVIIRQRPESAKGVFFITLEDETGFCNLVIFSHVYEKFRRTILQSRLLLAKGKVQKESGVTHVIVQECEDCTEMIRGLKMGLRDG